MLERGLGADRGRIIQTVLRGPIIQTVVGLAIGFSLALLATRVIATQLYSVGRNDPTVLGLTPLVLLAAAIAAPAAVALNTATVRAMAGTAHTGIPASFTQVLPPSRLALLPLAAVLIAVAGALLPAAWAARARPATALRAE